MRALYIPTILLAAIIGFSLWNSAATENLTNSQLRLLEDAHEQADAENWPRVTALLDEADRQWENHRVFLHTTNRHDDLGEIRSLLIGAQAACDARDTDECLVLLAQLQLRLELLAENHRITVGNIL